jgi:DNA-binding transcriptional MerR regulator
MSSKDNSEFSIGAVAGMTGLSTQVIRAWERRYQAVVAARSANGRRVYSADDVNKLSVLKALTDQGTPISSVAQLDLKALKALAQEMEQICARPVTGNVKVAVLGAFLPAMLASSRMSAYPLELVAGSADPKRLLSDLRHQNIDVLVVETINLNTNSRRMIDELQASCRPRELVVAYGFARRADEDSLLQAGARLLRTPVGADELASAILAAVSRPAASGASSHGADNRAASRQQAGNDEPVSTFASGPRPRRYSEQQLCFLADIETDVDCECPRQVAEILKILSAFEAYSAECESLNEQDAALHAYLHQATAHSRAVMEQALDRLIEVEQIKL